MSDLSVENCGDGDFVLRVRCASCGAFGRADGLPIIMVYKTDDGRVTVCRGVMAPVMHRSHSDACRGTVEQ